METNVASLPRVMGGYAQSVLFVTTTKLPPLS